MALAKNTNSAKTALNGSGEASTDIDDIKADVAALRSDFASLFSTMKEAAKTKSSEGLEVGKEAAESAQNNMVDAKTYVENQVRTNPLAAVGIAVGIGALLASVRRS